MSPHAIDAVAVRVARANRIRATASRIFVALRDETRALRVSNDDVVQLLDLAELLAARIVDGTGGHARETHVIARTCAALDAGRAACGGLAGAIRRVRDRIDDLLR
jgi:hypothetical protein